MMEQAKCYKSESLDARPVSQRFALLAICPAKGATHVPIYHIKCEAASNLAPNNLFQESVICPAAAITHAYTYHIWCNLIKFGAKYSVSDVSDSPGERNETLHRKRHFSVSQDWRKTRNPDIKPEVLI